MPGSLTVVRENVSGLTEVREMSGGKSLRKCSLSLISCFSIYQCLLCCCRLFVSPWFYHFHHSHADCMSGKPVKIGNVRETDEIDLKLENFKEVSGRESHRGKLYCWCYVWCWHWTKKPRKKCKKSNPVDMTCKSWLYMCICVCAQFWYTVLHRQSSLWETWYYVE